MAEPNLDASQHKENGSPGLVIRLLGLIPLLYSAYLLFIVGWRISPNFKQMFEEMNLGSLPWRTELLITILNNGGIMISAAILAGAGIFYWKKASRTSTGLVCFNTIAFIVCHQAYWFVLNALFDPMIEIMQRIGK